MKQKILITCPKGIPPVLRTELEAMGLPALESRPAAVVTEGTLEDAMRLNLHLRTGHRVLLQVREFQAANPKELYDRLVEIPWEEHLREDGYFSVSSSVHTPSVRDTRFASLKCKDAVADRIRKTRGRRPDSGPLQDKAVVFLYWKENDAAVYFDTSGEPLSRRGYRKIGLDAPMQETLAAAVVMTTRWKPGENFVNPMCGSGTLAIEAALLALGRAPGLLRDNFGFMHLKDFQAEPWQRLRAEARSAVRERTESRIVATDIRPQAVEAAKRNAAAAGVEKMIEFGVCDFADTPVPGGGGVVVMNPEYGERMGDEEKLRPVYRRIGDFLKKRCAGYTGYVFTGNPALAGRIALKPSRKVKFFNGEIECRLMEYEMYHGSRADE